MTPVASLVDRLREFGGDLILAGGRLRYRIPAGNPKARELLAEIRRAGPSIIAMLQDIESRAPSLDEVTTMLPPDTRVLRYKPGSVPFAVAPISIVTNAGKFFRAYLADLASRLAHPSTYAAPPLDDILAKLAEAGLELKVDR